jgi:hypothetical protein
LFLFCFSSSCVPHVASFSGLFLFCFSIHVSHKTPVVLSHIFWLFQSISKIPNAPEAPWCSTPNS